MTMSRQLLQISEKLKFHLLFGQPLPVLGYLNSKEVFPDIQMEPPVSQFVPSVSCHGTNEKSLASSSLHSCFRYLYTLVRFSRAFFFPGWTVPALSYSSQEKCCSGFVIFVALSWTLSGVLMSLVYLGAQNQTQHSWSQDISCVWEL